MIVMEKQSCQPLLILWFLVASFKVYFWLKHLIYSMYFQQILFPETEQAWHYIKGVPVKEVWNYPTEFQTLVTGGVVPVSKEWRTHEKQAARELVSLLSQCPSAIVLEEELVRNCMSWLALPVEIIGIKWGLSSVVCLLIVLSML